MNFDAKLPQFAPHNFQPARIKDICLDQEVGLNLLASAEDRDTFRRDVAHQLDAYYKAPVRYAISLMGGNSRGSWRDVCRRVADAWICKTMSENVSVV